MTRQVTITKMQRVIQSIIEGNYSKLEQLLPSGQHFFEVF